MQISSVLCPRICIGQRLRLPFCIDIGHYVESLVISFDEVIKYGCDKMYRLRLWLVERIGCVDLDHYLNLPDYSNGPSCVITGTRITHMSRELVKICFIK